MKVYFHDPIIEGLFYGLTLGIKILYYDIYIYLS